MRRSFVWVGALLLAVAGLAAQRTEAFITTLTPLRGILADSQFIFTVKVDALDPDRPSVVLIVDEDLKGKAPFRRLPVNLTGDQAAQKAKHPAQLLKRLAPKLPLVVFVRQRGDRFDALAYTNGTWFQMVGHRSSDTDAVRWAFTHCEPYLRRTFKGTTAELRQVIGDALAGKKTPPEPDPREPPGLGPEVPENDDGGTRKDERPEAGGSFPSSFLAPCSSCGRGPVFAVIPTVLVGGPAAILAMLFPALFGGLILLLRRWAAVLTVASLNSTLFLLHGWLYPSIRDRWWGTPAALWVAMTLITIAGIFWAWRRHRRAVRAGEAGQP
ncbi:MAG TPA: hypothetical protein VNK04_04015, partial [Gemmataceae bacterium]|nr:hypothetical protein [Gemmataceae bacterium]